MSGLGGTTAGAQLVTEIPLQSAEEKAGEAEEEQHLWDKWLNDGTEEQVVKLMEEDISAAMQFIQSKALCIMPISLIATIYHHHQPKLPLVKLLDVDTPS